MGELGIGRDQSDMGTEEKDGSVGFGDGHQTGPKRPRLRIERSAVMHCALCCMQPPFPAA